MDNCIFCRIVKGEVPSYKIYEDPNCFVFLDIHPQEVGHTLVVPKKHYRWVWDVEENGYFESIKKVANILRKAFGTEWVILKVVGDEVPHAHAHLIPKGVTGDPKDFDKNAEIIKNFL